MECVLNDKLAGKCKSSVSSEPSGEMITLLNGIFHYGSFGNYSESMYSHKFPDQSSSLEIVN